ncbi:2,3-bisphosphoglycerate-dependent phosphoglycerate mutase [Nodosilinea nodulosa]|uniref:2,3-bisphosphoglycerate-dependent phosphoglycerate mutase n=1 Tax=Nodosilinea nodulosa TaxID=416001 RepID=UPI0002D27E3F|nr:2,3-bisphosphoglycerate-dependent phosphoglycerate mutase [Nodosilinea nodulosa]
MAKLILIRHGQSLWNAANRFTGWVDVPLSDRGRAEATVASCKLRDGGYAVDICFTSMLIRAIETAIVCLTECHEVRGGRMLYLWHDPAEPDWHGWDHHIGQPEDELKLIRSPALDERYYGDLQGLNKAEMAQKFGEQQVHLWRRSYDVRPPGGESLADTVKRTVPFFEQAILPELRAGKNVMVAAHGNSLRSILMYIDRLGEDEVAGLELATGVPIIYDVDGEGAFTHKAVLTQ